jgi:hypothetical protein
MMKLRAIFFLAMIGSTSACTTAEPTAAIERVPAWEPIDPGFVGCEGG